MYNNIKILNEQQQIIRNIFAHFLTLFKYLSDSTISEILSSHVLENVNNRFSFKIKFRFQINSRKLFTA